MHGQAIESHAMRDLGARKIFLLGRSFFSSRTGAERAHCISLSFKVEHPASTAARFYAKKVSLAAKVENKKMYWGRKEPYVLQTPSSVTS